MRWWHGESGSQTCKSSHCKSRPLHDSIMGICLIPLKRIVVLLREGQKWRLLISRMAGTKKPPFGGFTTLLIALIILLFPMVAGVGLEPTQRERRGILNHACYRELSNTYDDFSPLNHNFLARSINNLALPKRHNGEHFYFTKVNNGRPLNRHG